jgi:hypothetical protein
MAQQTSDGELEQAEEDVSTKIYEVPATTKYGSFRLDLPGELAQYHGLEHTAPVRFVPKIEVLDELTGEAEVSFEVRVTDGEGRRDEMHLWRKHQMVRLRFPREFVTGLEAYSLEEDRPSIDALAKKGELTVEVGTIERGVLSVRFVPPALAWELPTDGGSDAFQHEPRKEWPVTKTLVEYKHGVDSQYDALRIELPREFAHESVLDLDGGEPAATRLTHIDGEPALVIDLAVDADERDQPHVRTLFRSDWIKVGGKTYNQFRMIFPKTWTQTLGWDAETELELAPGPERILITRA